jgi:hypothetical protein
MRFDSSDRTTIDSMAVGRTSIIKFAELCG